jgi:hypothetical protein
VAVSFKPTVIGLALFVGNFLRAILLVFAYFFEVCPTKIFAELSVFLWLL